MKSESEIPVIDFSRFRTADAHERGDVSRLIRDINTKLGFVYLAGTGIPQPCVDHMFTQSAAFFHLPDVQKRALAEAHRVNEELDCGYVPQGREHEDAATPSDIKEAFDVFPAEGYICDAFVRAPNGGMLPENVAPLVDVFAAFHARCSLVANDVLRAFALGFGLAETYFVSRHGRNSTLRVLHYPPVTEQALKGQMRVGSHTDFGTMTLLFQDPTGGLEVLSADHRWLRAPSIPGTVLINIGDLMQQWTNLEFRSTQHRVGIPSDARVRCSRYSIAFFCEPNNTTEVACLPGVRDSNRPRFAPVLAGDYLRKRLGRTLINKV